MLKNICIRPNTVLATGQILDFRFVGCSKMSGKKVVLDCDPGPDDAQALMMLLARDSHVNLLAVTTVFGNGEVHKSTQNALRTLNMCSRLDVSTLFSFYPYNRFTDTKFNRVYKYGVFFLDE